MRDFHLTRRNFLKLAGVGAVVTGAGLSSLPSPLHARGNSKKLDKILDYQRGKRTINFCEMCFWNCGVDVYTVDGKLKKLEGNKLNPNNTGTLCAKGNAGIESTYDVDRIKYPMKRVGKRGEGKWKKISWEEAYDYIYEKVSAIIDEHGATSIAGFAHGTNEHYFRTFINALGSPNFGIPSFSECRGSRAIGYALTYGGGGIGGHEYYDMKNTKYMILFGRNMAGAIQVREAKDFIEGISRGAKLVYVDPRLSESGVKAHKWLQIDPGYDLALALALIHVIIKDNLFNIDFVRKYCYGFNELREHVKQYTPQWAEKLCGIKAKIIEEVAWEFAKYAPHVLAIAPRRFSRYGNDTQSARAIAVLNALMGNYGVVGGVWQSTKFPLELHHGEKPPKIEEQRVDGAGTTYPVSPANLGLANGIYKATLTKKPYPIKAWLICATNPLGHTAVENAKLLECIDNLDFIMSIDTQMNDTAYYSDIVLPESTYLERTDAPYIQKDAYPFITLREPAIKKVYDTKHTFEICKELAKRFDFEEYFEISPEDSAKMLYEKLDKDQKKKLKEDGILIYEETMPYPQTSGLTLKFPTPTGKIQLYAPQLKELYEKHGDTCNPLPTFTPPLREPEEGQFRLLFGRGPAHSHARSQNNWLLLELEDDCPIWIHPDDAKILKLNKDDKIIIKNVTTGYKSHPQAIKITKRIKKGNLFIHHGFGHISKGMTRTYNKGISDVYFCSDDVDPISGCSGFNNGFVTIQKV